VCGVRSELGARFAIRGDGRRARGCAACGMGRAVIARASCGAALPLTAQRCAVVESGAMRGVGARSGER
jgi:hypothetical protein